MAPQERALEVPPYAAARASVLRLPGGRSDSDRLAVEEPLEIRIGGEAMAVTMRTPGHDEELALGFLLGEGLIDGPRPAGPPPDLEANVVEVAGPLARTPTARRFYTT